MLIASHRQALTHSRAHSGFPLGCKSACLAGIGDSGKFRRLLTSLFDRCVDTILYSEQPQLLHGLIRLTGNMPGIRRGVLLLFQSVQSSLNWAMLYR